MPREHRLKTWPEPYEAVASGRKPYEIRVDDRGFAVGDVLVLEEWDPENVFDEASWSVIRPRGYTGRSVTKVVTYMTPGGKWGLPVELCVLGLADIPPDAGARG